MPPQYRFHESHHSRHRASERDLSFGDLKAAVISPDRQEDLHRKGNHGGKIYKFFKSIHGRTLVCVAELRNNECWILTGYSQ